MKRRPDDLFRAATLSGCGLYRYDLIRSWDWSAERRSFVVIELNPSTADATQDDPTIRRCVRFGRREGCGRLVMLNLFAFRATNPQELLSAADPIGPDNDARFVRLARALDATVPPLVVAAWGAHPMAGARAAAIAAMYHPGVQCFGLTNEGAPRHPLYLHGDTPLVPLGWGRA